MSESIKSLFATDSSETIKKIEILKYVFKILINHEKLVECLIFLNSGGVTSKTFFLPMNNFFLKMLGEIDKILIKLMPNIFCMGRQIVLMKN